ncbi:MAG: glycogen synthase, partial [Gammaproteobacteria bacterium]
LKGGLVYADRLTTVSPTYAQEIQTPELGHGLDGVLRGRASVLSGILNGIDDAIWDPARDPLIATRFDAGRWLDRRLNKRALQAAFGLPQDDDQFLIGAVARFADQKGIDLILDSIPALLPAPIQWLLLGSGERHLEQRVIALGAAHPQRIGYRIAFDTPLSHQMFAGLDAFLMPSRFEPCGLAQLYSQRYGTVPIVRRTGGLTDSVVDATRPAATGFVFEAATGTALADAVRRALGTFQDAAAWQRLQRNGMAQDFSWDRSAREYLEVYRAADPTKT